LTKLADYGLLQLHSGENSAVTGLRDVAVKTRNKITDAYNLDSVDCHMSVQSFTLQYVSI